MRISNSQVFLKGRVVNLATKVIILLTVLFILVRSAVAEGSSPTIPEAPIIINSSQKMQTQYRPGVCNVSLTEDLRPVVHLIGYPPTLDWIEWISSSREEGVLFTGEILQVSGVSSRGIEASYVRHYHYDKPNTHQGGSRTVGFGWNGTFQSESFHALDQACEEFFDLPDVDNAEVKAQLQ